MTTAQQSPACLQALYHAQVAEAMPAAIRAALGDAKAIAGWLAGACEHTSPAAHFGPLDAADEPTLGSLSTPTLLALLFDQRQPECIVMAARNVLLGQYLSNEDVQALAVATANQMATQAVNAMRASCQRRCQQAEQLQRAEHQSLYGMEVPGACVHPAGC